MTFNEYLEYFEKHKKRMCKALQNNCSKCPLYKPWGCNVNFNALLNNYNEVKKWEMANPEVTYMEDFKKKFPNTEEKFFENVCRCEVYGRPDTTDEEGCPSNVTTCSECWNAPME